ncbi:MAG: glucose-6-phosphate isomerase [Candidatus Parcubacteria bacterium]|nr:hypothetical protein [Patescibacteria group bacterium]BCX15930.1 MAG: glucose-6-phosphate isomerase [Candidatus Parcubacteria bacterium]
MIDLKKISTLPLKLKRNRLVVNGRLVSQPSFEKKDYQTYKNFFQNQSLEKNRDLYYIYRNLALLKDIPLFQKFGLRYDLTVILAGKIGQEPIRTIGHFHKKNLAEIYQVIYGEALFYLQDKKNQKAYLIRKKEGEKIFIPANLGHITINPQKRKVLVIANIFSNFPSAADYSFFEKNHGPAWYLLINKNGFKLEKNPAYKNFPQVFKKLPFQPSIASGKKPIYQEFIKNPKKFLFLRKK